MKPAATVDARAVIRLRDEYKRRSFALNAKKADKTLSIGARQAIEQEGAVLFSVAQDLDDLINGKEHPSGRRS